MTIDTTYLDSDADSIKLARPAIKSMADLLNNMTGSTGSSEIGHLPSGVGSVATTVQAKLREIVSVEDSGAAVNGVADDSIPVQRLIDYCVESGIRYVRFNSGNCYLASELKNRHEVTFVGEGVFSGPGAYGMRFCKADAPPAQVFQGPKFSSLKHASKFLRRIVIVGDSLTTEGPNAVDGRECFLSYLAEKVRLDNPGRAIEVIGRGVGGTVFAELDDKPVTTYLPAWYTDAGSPWLSYIEALKPELVIVAMGMNGADNGDNIASIISIRNKILAFANSPDVIFATPPVPSSQCHADYYASHSTKLQQEARNNVAWAIRSCGKYYGFPVVDVNRRSNMIRDGVDPVSVEMQRYPSPALSGGGFISPIESAHGWSVTVGVPSRAVYGTNTNIAIKLDNSGAACFVTLTPSFELLLTLYGKPGLPYSSVTLSNQIVPNSAHQLIISVRDSSLSVQVAGSPTPAPVPFVHESGNFFPAVGNYLSGYFSGSFSSISAFNYSRSRKCLPIVTNNEIWGVGSSDSGTHLPYGGNGINHPTDMGARRLYQDTLEGCNFSAEEKALSVFEQQASNAGAATLTLSPVIPSGYVRGNPNARAIYVYAHAHESTGAVYSTAWYRLVDFGNGKWVLSAPIGKMSSPGGGVDHSLSVNVDSGVLTLTNTIATPVNAKNFIGTSFDMTTMGAAP